MNKECTTYICASNKPPQIHRYALFILQFRIVAVASLSKNKEIVSFCLNKIDIIEND